MKVFPEWRNVLRVEPSMHATLLSGIAVLLAIADWLPTNPLVDPDTVEFDLTVIAGLMAIGLVVQTRVTREVIAAWLRRGLLFGATAALALLATEAAARYIFRDVTTSADTGSFFSRRWLNDVQFNAGGFRAPEFDARKKPGTYRIAVIGDSFTFGNGLTVEQRYTNLLGAWLGNRYEVLNFGVGGDNTPQHLDALNRHVLPAAPDFVLLQWFINDIEGNDASGRPRPWLLFPQPLHEWFNRRSALYAVANVRWVEIQVALGWSKSYADYLKARALDPASADAQREAQLLREFIATARSRGSAVGIVLFPDSGAFLDATYPFGFLHEQVLGICRETAVDCLDLRRDFAAVHDRRSLWVSPFDHHPSAKANELAALKILDTFGKQWQSR